jgi:hypothetical protein
LTSAFESINNLLGKSLAISVAQDSTLSNPLRPDSLIRQLRLDFLTCAPALEPDRKPHLAPALSVDISLHMTGCGAAVYAYHIAASTSGITN